MGSGRYVYLVTAGRFFLLFALAHLQQELVKQALPFPHLLNVAESLLLTVLGRELAERGPAKGTTFSISNSRRLRAFSCGMIHGTTIYDCTVPSHRTLCRR